MRSVGHPSIADDILDTPAIRCPGEKGMTETKEMSAQIVAKFSLHDRPPQIDLKM
jgi:hypothetical protein